MPTEVECDRLRTAEAILVVRSMTAKDLSRVLAIDRHSFAAALTERVLRHELQSQRSNGLLVVNKGDVIGYAIWWLVSGEAHLHRIAVSHQFRGRGVGSHFLRHILQAMQARGAERVLLEVRASNEAALALYHRHDFVVVGRRRNYYSQGEDAILMTLNFSEGYIYGLV